MRRVSGVLLIASRQISFEAIGSPEFQAFVDCCGGVAEKSKGEYLKILPSLYDAIYSMYAQETGDIIIGSFCYE